MGDKLKATGAGNLFVVFGEPDLRVTPAGDGLVQVEIIRQQTGHASDAMLGRYIRDGELFVGNAAGALL